MKPKTYYEIKNNFDLALIPFKSISSMTLVKCSRREWVVSFYYNGSDERVSEAGEDATKMYNAYKEWIDSQ